MSVQVKSLICPTHGRVAAVASGKSHTANTLFNVATLSPLGSLTGMNDFLCPQCGQCCGATAEVAKIKEEAKSAPTPTWIWIVAIIFATYTIIF